MKSLKGIVTYMGIVILSVILIGALAIGIMFFTKKSFFGYYFLSVKNNSVYVTEIDLTNPVDKELENPITEVKLNVETGRYGIIITPSDNRFIQVTCNNNYVGLVEASKGEGGNVLHKFPVLTQEIMLNGKNQLEVNLKFAEPQGVISYSDESKILVGVPFKLDENIIQYDINTTTEDGDIQLANSVDKNGKFEHPLTVSGLKIKTNKGDFIPQGFGDRKGNPTKHLKLSSLNINTNGGTFDFSKFTTVTVDNKVLLDSKKANYKFNTLISHNDDDLHTGGVEITGTVVKFEANVVDCGSDGFIYKSETGLLKVNKLYSGELENSESVELMEKTLEGKKVGTGIYNDKITKVSPYENTVFTDSAEVELGTVIGKLGLYNEYGNVTIGLLSNQASIRTENGNISISKSGTLINEVDAVDESGKVIPENTHYADTSALILYSTFGDITVGEYYQDAVIYSKKGKINVYSKYHSYKTEEGKDGQEVKSRYFYSNISTKDGQITAKTDKNPIVVESSSSATINLTIFDILPSKDGYKVMNPFVNSDMYQATSKNGTVNITVPIRSYKVLVSANKIEGSIGATTKFGAEYVQINNEADNQPSIKIVSKKAILQSLV